MAYAEIGYGGGGVAKIYGDFRRADAQIFFTAMANQCFGIRKSIMTFDLRSYDADAGLPDPWGQMPGASRMLSHNCGGGPFEDIAVWDADGEKIKSEFD